ncbi:MAG: CoA transferase [Deltaproteobacteria bacterium]|nr:CoA transferase [Deltaproteobacteria bacterium]
MMALAGIRVVDLSRYAPGPYCTMLLADLGADVVVVEEPPGVGRRVDTEMGVSERTKAFLPMGRNKRSAALDLKNERMRAAFFRLVDRADVVVEGFRPGVAARLGVDYDAVSRRNPRAVYCSISGYGQNGPHAALPGHDLNYISLAGVLGMIGWPGQPPAIPLNVIADFAGGGLFAAFSILAALIARQQTGRGQYIDMAMSDGVLSLACLAASDYFSSGTAPKPGEYYVNGALPCYHVYPTADGKWLSVACMEPWFWQKLCTALGCEQYAAEQFNAEKFPEMFAFLRRRFKEQTRDQWFAELKDRDICVTPVYGLDEALADPHTAARRMIAEVPHPQHGGVRQIGIAPKFSETPGAVRTLAPRPGEHTAEVLAEIGYSAEEIARLIGPHAGE